MGASRIVLHPDTPEKSLILSLGNDTSFNATVTGESGRGDTGGVMWTVSTSSTSSAEELEDGVMDWMVFPSTGMLLPGRR